MGCQILLSLNQRHTSESGGELEHGWTSRRTPVESQFIILSLLPCLEDGVMEFGDRLIQLLRPGELTGGQKQPFWDLDFARALRHNRPE